ncbi:MAG: hypothetical protein WBW61_05725 [Rhodanobacteraceae bacterium]
MGIAALNPSYKNTDIMAGGGLHFVMQAEPDRAWGSGVGARPYSMTPE